MAASQDPNLDLYYGWDFRESGWKTGMDANLKKLGAVVHLSVLSHTTTAPPGAPTNGDRYIIPAGATGDWTGLTGQIAVRVAGAWEYYTPEEGWQAWTEALDCMLVYTSAAWSVPGAASGTWSNPARIGGIRIWHDATNDVTRVKYGSEPSDEQDGTFFQEAGGPGNE